jgi:hypothetical protein
MWTLKPISPHSGRQLHGSDFCSPLSQILYGTSMDQVTLDSQGNEWVGMSGAPLGGATVLGTDCTASSETMYGEVVI